MDVVDFWKAQVDIWNAEEFCGQCWFFGAPLTEAGVNVQQTPQDKACCVHVVVSNLRESILPRYSNITGLLNDRRLTTSFTVHFLKQDGIGVNVYNEILGHPIEEGKYETILKPLKNCITVENVLNFCVVAGIDAKILTWGMEPRINWLDQNYTGWSVTMSIEVRNP